MSVEVYRLHVPPEQIVVEKLDDRGCGYILYVWPDLMNDRNGYRLIEYSWGRPKRTGLQSDSLFYIGATPKNKNHELAFKVLELLVDGL